MSWHRDNGHSREDEQEPQVHPSLDRGETRQLICEPQAAQAPAHDKIGSDLERESEHADAEHRCRARDKPRDAPCSPYCQMHCSNKDGGLAEHRRKAAEAGLEDEYAHRPQNKSRRKNHCKIKACRRRAAAGVTALSDAAVHRPSL